MNTSRFFCLRRCFSALVKMNSFPIFCLHASFTPWIYEIKDGFWLCFGIQCPHKKSFSGCNLSLLTIFNNNVSWRYSKKVVGVFKTFSKCATLNDCHALKGCHFLSFLFAHFLENASHVSGIWTPKREDFLPLDRWLTPFENWICSFPPLIQIWLMLWIWILPPFDDFLERF